VFSHAQVPESLTGGSAWRALQQADRVLSKLVRSLKQRLGADSEIVRYVEDARIALYDAGRTFPGECEPRVTRALGATLQRAEPRQTK
jgi:hypothetical protein